MSALAIARPPVPPFPLLVRVAAQPLLLDAVESVLGPLDRRSAAAPPTRDALTLLGRLLAARVLRSSVPSSARPRLALLLGVRPDDDRLAESLDQAWAATPLPQRVRDELEAVALAYRDHLRTLQLAAAGSSGRGRQMLSRLPAFMRADRSGKALGQFVHALGRDLDQADRLLGRIRDAHALRAADEERDLLQLAAALGLQRADFLILAKLKDKGFFATAAGPDADPLDRATAAYRLYITDLRQAIERQARIMLRGCATVPALLEGAMVLVDADPRDPAAPAADPELDARYPDQLIVHPDRQLPRGGFIHGLPIRFGVIDGSGADARRALRDGFVYLVENPIVDRSSERLPRRGRDRFRVERGGFFHGPVAARIIGQGDRTVHPRLVNLATHRGFGFAGTVADGQELVVATNGQAFLGGADVTARCHLFKGGLIDGTSFGDATPSGAFAISVPAQALGRNLPRPAIERVTPLPTLRLLLGTSDWQFDVEEGAFDASAFDGCVFAWPADPAARAALPASAEVQLSWREHEPFTARVLLPSGLQTLETALLDGASLRTLVRAGLERFRAAGIRLEVDWFDDTWVLDESVIRDAAVEAGLGVNFDATVPGAPPA